MMRLMSISSPRNCWILQVLLVVLLIALLCLGVSDACIYESANVVFRECNPLLADVSSAILVLLDSNYVHVCRYFSSYVECMHPTFQCTEFVHEFWTNYDTYTGAPYNCKLNDSAVLPKKLTEMKEDYGNDFLDILGQDLYGTGGYYGDDFGFPIKSELSSSATVVCCWTEVNSVVIATFTLAFLTIWQFSDNEIRVT